MRKVLLYFHTIRCLKIRQIKYQCIYAISRIIKWPFPVSHNLKIKFPHVGQAFYFPKDAFLSSLSFHFLNVCHTFQDKIDWNFNGHGKLWNYNLQYLDLLNDESIPVYVRMNWLQDISSNILKGKLKLEPYPVSIRLCNTLYFNAKHNISDIDIQTAFIFQFDYLRNNLEYHIDGNHLLENRISLLVSAVALLPEVEIQKYYNLLISELKAQLFCDGGHYEKCQMYHRILLYKLLFTYDLISNNCSNSIDISVFEKCLKDMMSWLKYITKSGRYESRSQDSDNKFGPSTTDTYTYYLKLFNEINPVDLLVDSGFRILENDSVFLLFNGGNISPRFQSGHNHCDLLSFEFYVKNLAIIVDRGISTYNNNPVRLEERSTKSHNTICINNQNQAEVWAAFRCGRRSKVVNLTADQNRISCRLKKSWAEVYEHQRDIVLADNCLIIEDALYPTIVKKASAYFHFHPLAELFIIDQNTLEIIMEGQSVILTFDGHKELKIGEYYYNYGFNKKHHSKYVALEIVNSLITKITW